MIHWQDSGGMMGRQVSMTSLLPTVIPKDRGDVHVYAARPTQAPRTSIRDRVVRSRKRLRTTIRKPLQRVLDTPSNNLGQEFPDASESVLMWRQMVQQREANEVESYDPTTEELDPEVRCYSYEHQVSNVETTVTDGYVHKLQRYESVISNSPLAKEGPMEITQINLNIAENTKAHHTNKFYMLEDRKSISLVLRRGQEFHIDVTFEKLFNSAHDEIKLLFEMDVSETRWLRTGDMPLESRGTRLEISLYQEVPSKLENDPNSSWAEIASMNGNTAKIRIYMAADTVVGVWNCKIISTKVRPPEARMDLMSVAQDAISSKRLHYIYPVTKMYILFNPWCKSDQVYMPEEKELEEYILNDVGKIWRGSHNCISTTPWVYGQFESLVLDACMAVLEHSRLPLPLRSSPIHVSRAVAAMISTPDLECVVQERWVPDYTGGRDPNTWTGSTEILRIYHATRQPVPYGQSFVFAGVFTAVCRCLGIPTRTVTGYSTAHDSETTTTIDIHFDIEGRPLKHLNTDSIWTHHVWSECWMERIDLPDGYGGWQILDGTPSEKCEGIDNAGPTPLVALYKGEIGLGYDTAFVFSELNADIIYWLSTGEGVRYIRREEHRIGLNISTRDPEKPLISGNDDRLDITDLYKDKPGTGDKLLKMMERLFSGGSDKAIAAQAMERQAVEDVSFMLNMSEEHLIGTDFPVKIRMRNKSDELRTVHLAVRIEAVQYFGSKPKKVRSSRVTVKLDPRCETQVAIAILVRDYIERIMDQSVLKVAVLGHVDETGQVFATSDDYKLKSPTVSITSGSGAKVNQELSLRLELVNPIPVQLSDCKFIIEGPGLTHATEIPCRSVMPFGAAIAETEIKPWRSGELPLVARFWSTSLQNVHGMATVSVRPS